MAFLVCCAEPRSPSSPATRLRLWKSTGRPCFSTSQSVGRLALLDHGYFGPQTAWFPFLAPPPGTDAPSPISTSASELSELSTSPSPRTQCVTTGSSGDLRPPQDSTLQSRCSHARENKRTGGMTFRSPRRHGRRTVPIAHMIARCCLVWCVCRIIMAQAIGKPKKTTNFQFSSLSRSWQPRRREAAP